jgi:hypothetical protein
MTSPLKFFSTLASVDDPYHIFYDNFIGHLKRLGLEDRHELITLDDCDPGLYGSTAFNKICHLRTNITIDNLRKGVRVFHCDLDIVFLKDPFPYLLSLLEENDVVFQNDSKRVCGGFYLANPGEDTASLFDFSDEADYGTGDDQDYIHKRLWFKTSKYGGRTLRQGERWKDLKIHVLDNDMFPYGRWYYNRDVPDPYIVHYNWGDTSLEGKIERMKKYGHWLL